MKVAGDEMPRLLPTQKLPSLSVIRRPTHGAHLEHSLGRGELATGRLTAAKAVRRSSRVIE